MEILNISDIKLKITLSADECRAYRLDSESTDYLGPEIRRAAREILSQAEQSGRFYTEGDRVLIQTCPLPDGRCELLVTRLMNISRRDRDAISSSLGVSILESRRATFRFPDTDILKRAVTALAHGGIISDLYCDDLGRYYIHAVEELADGFSELDVLLEYGERLSSLPIAVLSEYGSLLAKDNAIDRIKSGELEL